MKAAVLGRGGRSYCCYLIYVVLSVSTEARVHMSPKTVWCVPSRGHQKSEIVIESGTTSCFANTTSENHEVMKETCQTLSPYIDIVHGRRAEPARTTGLFVLARFLPGIFCFVYVNRNTWY